MLTVAGSIIVSVMVLAYWFESRSLWLILVFSAASLGTAIYSGLSGVYPIMVIEAVWSLIALQRFVRAWREKAGQDLPAPPRLDERPPQGKNAWAKKAPS